MNIWLIVVGRCLYGLASGVMITASAKFLEETVPSNIFERGFGNTTNQLGSALVLLMVISAEFIPITTSSLENTSTWRLIYAFPVPFLFISLFSFLFYLKEDSLVNHLQKDDDEEVKSIITKIYSRESEII